MFDPHTGIYFVWRAGVFPPGDETRVYMTASGHGQNAHITEYFSSEHLRRHSEEVLVREAMQRAEHKLNHMPSVPPENKLGVLRHLVQMAKAAVA